MKASNEKADICQADISVFVTILSPNFHTHLPTHPPANPPTFELSSSAAFYFSHHL